MRVRPTLFTCLLSTVPQSPSAPAPLTQGSLKAVEILHCARAALVLNDKKIVYARIISFVILSVAKDLIFNARSATLIPNSYFRIPNYIQSGVEKFILLRNYSGAMPINSVQQPSGVKILIT